MKKNMIIKKTPLLAVAILLAASLAHAQLGTATGTTAVNVTVGAEAALTAVTASTNLTSAGTNFTNYTGGPTNLTYFIRTTAVGGSGTITAKVTTDFSPINGPSVAIPPTAGDALTFTCTATAPGNGGAATPCAAAMTASTTVAQTAVTFGTNARSAIAGNAASVSWTLTNDPKYQTGTYSATVTFTISAL